VLPTLFIALAAIALLLTLLWLWQSLRMAFVQTLAASGAEASGVVSAERAALLAEKQALLLALKDLEAEREAGKLSAADFAELNAQYRARARQVLQKLDEMLAPHRARARAMLGEGAEPEAVASVTSASTVTASGARAEATAAAAVTAPAAKTCASCAAVNDADAVFCKRCGTRLAAKVEA